MLTPFTPHKLFRENLLKVTISREKIIHRKPTGLHIMTIWELKTELKPLNFCILTVICQKYIELSIEFMKICRNRLSLVNLHALKIVNSRADFYFKDNTEQIMSETISYLAIFRFIGHF